jgi:hypothetical protein
MSDQQAGQTGTDDGYLLSSLRTAYMDTRRRLEEFCVQAADRIEALTVELAEEKRMRQEEKAKILRQREQLDAIQKANRNNLPMRRELQRRVAELEAAEADNARLREALDKDLAAILKGKPLTEPPHVFPRADAENYWRLRAQLGEAQAGRSIQMCEVYRQQAVTMQRKADADANQASRREKKLRDTIAAITEEETK